MIHWPFFYLGLFGSCSLAFISFQKELLTRSGSLGLILIGLPIATFGTWPSWLAIGLFFASSACLQAAIRFGLLAEAPSQVTLKSGPRDFFQVCANALPATCCLVIGALTQNSAFTLAYYAALAAACADTFASELGMYARQKPYWLLQRRPVPTGLSGGVTYFGTFASAIGSLLISGFVGLSATWIPLAPPNSRIVLVGFLFLCGLFGSLLDSLLGETVQAVYQTATGQLTEEPRLADHAVLKKGYPFFTNDIVNFSCTLSICLLTILLTKLLINLGVFS